MQQKCRIYIKNIHNMPKICTRCKKIWKRPDQISAKYAKKYAKNMQKERPDMQNKQTYANICKISQKYAVLFCVSIFCTYMQSMHRGLCWWSRHGASRGPATVPGTGSHIVSLAALASVCYQAVMVATGASDIAFEALQEGLQTWRHSKCPFLA